MSVTQINSLCGPSGPFPMVKPNIDWITATHTRGNQTKEAYAAGYFMVENEAQAGNDIQPINWRGYRGFRSGGATVGVRSDGVFLQARSGVAQDYFPIIKEFATNYSRIDCAVTALADKQQPQIFRQMFRKLENRTGVGHRKNSVTIIANRDYGDTLNFGRRSSDRYGRFYDKGLEQKVSEAGWLFRWEVECKNDYAKWVGQRLNDDNSLELVSHNVVSRYFAGCGVTVPGMPLEFSLVGDEFAHAVKPSDDNRRLSWLKSMVRPTVARLNSRGRLETVCRALGLSVKDGVIVFEDEDEFIN